MRRLHSRRFSPVAWRRRDHGFVAVFHTEFDTHCVSVGILFAIDQSYEVSFNLLKLKNEPIFAPIDIFLLSLQ